MCRSSTDECDLPEFCNGSSSFCQSDVFVQVCCRVCVVVYKADLEIFKVLGLVSDWANSGFQSRLNYTAITH